MTAQEEVGYQLRSSELHEQQKKIQHLKDGPVVVAVGLSDLYNVAGILRCAEAIGCRKVYFIDIQVSNKKKLERMSRSTTRLLDYQFLTKEKFLEIFQELPPLIALEITSKSQNLFLSDYPKDITLVVGAEKEGVPEDILKLCTLAVHLPMVGINSSLNVVSALCVALYHWHQKFREQ